MSCPAIDSSQRDGSDFAEISSSFASRKNRVYDSPKKGHYIVEKITDSADARGSAVASRRRRWQRLGLQYCPGQLGAGDAARKSQNREWPFAKVSGFAVRPVSSRAAYGYAVRVRHARVHHVHTCTELFASGDDDYFIFSRTQFARCAAAASPCVAPALPHAAAWLVKTRLAAFVRSLAACAHYLLLTCAHASHRVRRSAECGCAESRPLRQLLCINFTCT